MFRKIILTEMERRGLSHYAIVERIADRIPRRTVYNYLAGETDMGGERVAITFFSQRLRKTLDTDATVGTRYAGQIAYRGPGRLSFCICLSPAIAKA